MASSNQVMIDENPWPEVRYFDQGNKIILDNHIVQVTLSKPGGLITSIRYGGIDNLLEIHNKENNRGYWDLNWSEPDEKDNFDVPIGTEFQIVHSDGDKVEVSFARPYDANHHWTMVPLNIDKRFVMLRGHSGFYSYGIYERPRGWPDFNLNQTRITFKLRKDRFDYMAISDSRIRLMPSPEDRFNDRCQELAYPEAVLLNKPGDPVLQGRENRVHGWISTNPPVGFWIITPSDEFRNGGPTKQNLTAHVGPTCLAMFHSAHYAGIDLCPQFRNQEPWEKVFGPVVIYLNSGDIGAEPQFLWADAKRQMAEEVREWPYPWPCSPDFAKAEDRGEISGRLLVHDRYRIPNMCSATFAFLGLAVPGEKGSWQRESKGYQFWSQANQYGYFSIKNVRAGVYDLYGWVPGILGDYKREGSPIQISPGDIIPLGDLIYEPPRDGPTVWEIGIPDRTAAKFYVPDPNPKYVNRLYVDHPEKYRQYGLWARYSEIYPSEDLIYTVGRSNWTRDWFFAHLCRIEADGSYQPTTWQIKFSLPPCEQYHGVFKLRMAIAAANNAAIQVRVNDPCSKHVFDTMQFGKDNAIARHGIHGLYTLFNIDIPSACMRQGDNIIYLTQRKASGPFTGVMYDYLRLEAPPVYLSSVTNAFSRVEL